MLELYQSFFAGFSTCLALIVAIGAQNAWVLSMSIRGHHPYVIAAVCSFIDTALIAIGILLFRWLQKELEILEPWFFLAAILIIIYLITQNVYRVIKGNQMLQTQHVDKGLSAVNVAIKAASISLLNPHVYTDTVLGLGNIGASSLYPVAFWVGGASASTLWFLSLARFSETLKTWLTSPKRWRIFDSIIAITLTIVLVIMINHLDFSELYINW